MLKLFTLTLGFVCLAATATAQPWPTNCGQVTAGNEIYQAGTSEYVSTYYLTSRPTTNLCPANVQAEGWVDRYGGAVNSGQHYRTAQVWGGVPVPYGVTATSIGKHWLIELWNPWAPNWISLGHTYKQAEVKAPQNADASMCATDPNWPGCENSPIIVDTAGDGYRLTSAAEGVRFDLTGDGQPEQIAWTHAGSDDAWLALDRNQNGVIDSGRELFGNVTLVQPDVTAMNGFEALKFLGVDAQLDARDGAFGGLLLWRDANHNGISEPDELQSISAAGLVTLSTEAKESRRRDRHGNEYRLRARSAWADGGQRPVWDVWLTTEAR